jgi:peptide/nickel transport system ATP-binding protein
MTDDLLLKVENLSVSFRSGKQWRSAVHNVSFDVKKGKTLAIVGESGSGKSVSSLSLMQLLVKGRARFDSGTFTFASGFFGTEQKLMPDDDALGTLRGKHLAMIFQEPMTSLNPVMHCGKQVAEVLEFHKGLTPDKAQNEALELFREVQLPRPEAMLMQYPHQLSGGQRQRVMIAMALACRPQLLIADEPTTALDVTVQKGILDTLSSIQRARGMGMIFITHDLGVVKDIADDVLVMRRGEQVEYGQANEVLQSPRHPYTKGLLACKPGAATKGKPLITVEDVLSGREPAGLPYSSHAGEILLEVNGLTKVYQRTSVWWRRDTGGVKAVDNVSFSLAKGETLGLVGESGCGKTTLSRMLLGLIPSTTGSVRYNGREMSRFTPREWRRARKEVQIIFQDPYSSLNPRMMVGEAIMEPMHVFGLYTSATERMKACHELLESVGLPSSFDQRYPHELSGGQRQRVVIARALAVKPGLIICDESVSALDVSVQAQVLNLLNELKERLHLTYLFISHDLNVVYHMSDRIMVMRQGCVEEIGDAHEVFLRPRSEYTRKLLEAIPGR